MDNAIRMLHRDESNVEASTQKQKVRRQHNKSTPGYLSCHVCGDRAPNHIHYGGIACFSCRAFFRRFVNISLQCTELVMTKVEASTFFVT